MDYIHSEMLTYIARFWLSSAQLKVILEWSFSLGLALENLILELFGSAWHDLEMLGLTLPGVWNLALSNT